MTIEMRKRPVIKGKDALKFLERSERNKIQLIQRSKQAVNIGLKFPKNIGIKFLTFLF